MQAARVETAPTPAELLAQLRAEREAHARTTAALECLETLQATAPVGIGLIDRDGRIVRANDTLVATRALTAAAVIGLRISDVIPDVWPQVQPSYRHVLATGAPVLDVELSGPTAEEPGRIHHWLASYYPVLVDGEIIGVGVIVDDITERKENEQAHLALTQAAVGAISAAVEARDPYTAGHQDTVARLAGAIALEMGLDAHEVEGIRLAGSIHDIGKISTPPEILSKPSRLRPTELALVQEHARIGADIVRGIDFPWPIADMVGQHHERMDGSGYPDGLVGDEILLGARVIAVADVLDAMASHRPYRASSGLSAALRQIEVEAGTRLDADAVQACLRLFRDGRIELDAHWAP